MEKLLRLYCIWNEQVKHIPKDLRYSIGVKIGALFADVIEYISLAQFSTEEKRIPFIDHGIAKNDTLKFMLFALHELRGMEVAPFSDCAIRAEEIGKMLYGWKRNIEAKTPRV